MSTPPNRPVFVDNRDGNTLARAIIEKYEISVVASGSFEATSEEAFDCSAGVYLQD